MARNTFVERDNSIKRMELSTLMSAPGYEEAMNLNQRLETMDYYNRKASVALGKLEEAKVINSQMMKDVTGKVPANVSVNRLSVSMNTIKIEGTAPGKKTFAELQLHLKELPFIGDVYISSIDELKEGTGFEAVLECTIVREEAAE
jgi:hypothetical protein